jgi:hypothetical protein
MEKIKSYGLKQIMHQSDEQFIDILNQFWIVTQLQLDVDTKKINVFIHQQLIQNFHIYFTRMKQSKK